jgi:hypothetical protein
MFLKNVSFGPPFKISIEFLQKSLINMIFVEKNFGDFAKNCPLNMMSLPLPPPELFKIFRVSPPLT